MYLSSFTKCGRYFDHPLLSMYSKRRAENWSSALFPVFRGSTKRPSFPSISHRKHNVSFKRICSLVEFNVDKFGNSHERILEWKGLRSIP